MLASARPDRLAERARAAGTGYTTLRNDTRRFRGITVPEADPQDLAGELDALAHRAAVLDQSSDPIPRRAYDRAKNNIERDGGQTFEADACPPIAMRAPIWKGSCVR